MKVKVLRLGHRVERDERISTHVGLVARAFGANGIIYSGEKDERVVASLQDVVTRWGDDFIVDYQRDGKRVIKSFNGYKVVLSMYGIDLRDGIREITHQEDDSLLVVVGGQKVPGHVYDMVDVNVAVTHQPHSEVAALAVFLHELFEGKELDKTFEGAQLTVIPQRKGKKVREEKSDS
ncbi:MAG: tRNA (cytidine(56)-2'-O)-methyltransferase [Candidatus Korarchaeota archaeon]|nr:tRNA (cytidine(56)-2'-O)-methyltransferase [Candidatus Korarchaeota archaeon]NIU83077.1 tRNA (cytidine(56)-2'-O)-methyltransferase [Candidatus Thorarchaeota archaeon]NIW12621.1 tRNA (cytidine(56)-2'-O)-methyltransferase [Candidatus Thorarchaeota archaeon]NIW50832.1 tRNA (cytidine(56)-2'-O)-methyltransferase [Candidatus Korarchaeota archaeon]